MGSLIIYKLFHLFRLDINECAQDNDCHNNATCINNSGSYDCECNSGFRGDGKVCTGTSNIKCNNELLFIIVKM